MNKKRLFVTCFVALILMLSACSSKETAKPSDDAASKDTGIEKKEVDDKPRFAYTFPLTGKGTDEALASRAVAVMVNNAPEARPQSGLHKADIVYEVLAEGKITRLLAVFQSEEPDVIGPVRSARDYYVRLSNGFDAIYIHHGWSPAAKTMLTSGNIDSLNGLYYDGTLFKRANFRKAPHNSYITYENIMKESEKKKFELKQEIPAFSFLKEDEVTAIEGDPASTVTVSYGDHYKVHYRYQSEKGTYLRYVNNEKTVDRETEIPIELENVLVVGADHKVIDSAGRRNINLDSGGDAILFQQGKSQEINWKNENGRIIPVKDGAEVPFVPGKTWVNLVPASDLGPNVNWE
ncbi:DUF3048 domain-containing protein [Bacillus sp. Marseille-Q3570]|uniref:DUF3048 domain-containing protein n=1 Tax=Bacillus sp. Marseille-Q3570 TaxID=2963522 RepID=UPI0021B76C20|nr:DUF3048 domain-containing protein [Bacillus sp. Marseille-Q3570]